VPDPTALPQSDFIALRDRYLYAQLRGEVRDGRRAAVNAPTDSLVALVAAGGGKPPPGPAP
jgi:hypothetical protein